MKNIVEVDPFRCRPWDLHIRLEEYITEDSCRNEIQSFVEHGQLAPVLGRRIPERNGYDIELIFGARRLFAARHTRKPLAVELRELTDREAIIAMELENRQRKDVSPYERGFGYSRWLRTGQFQSQEEMAKILKISAAQLSRLLRLARLPTVIVDAFGNALEIAESWGLDISEALEDPGARPRMIRAAREIAAASSRPLAKDVYRKLMSTRAEGRKPAAASAARDMVVKGTDGEVLFRIRWQRKAMAMVVPIERVTAKSLENLRRAVSNVLEASNHSRGERAKLESVSPRTFPAKVEERAEGKELRS